MKIEFVDLKRQYHSIQSEVDQAIQDCLDQTRFIGGDPVNQFAESFAKYCHVNYCAPVANGTDALEIVLKAMGVGPGHEVIVPAFTFFATIEAVHHVGATPVLVDIDPNRFTIDPEKVLGKITDQTKCMIIVHLYGQMADMNPLMKIADEHGLFVIEDAAQSHGASDQGRVAGSMGHAGTFSFYPGKNLGAYGDAGAIVSNNEELYLNCKKIANHGRLSKYSHDTFGRNSRMDSIQAAVLNVKLKHLGEWTEGRRHVAKQYDELLAEIPELKPTSRFPKAPGVYHLYVVRIESSLREAFMTFMKSKGVSTGIHYPVSMPKLKAMEHLHLDQSEFPVANEYMNTVVSLPIYPELGKGEVEYVVESIKEFFEKQRNGSL